jgi:hypothetical protein
MRLVSSLLATLITSAAVAQVAIPAHSAIYNGYSRGFNFTASIPFIITQLDLPTNAFQAGDTAAYLVRINGNVAYWSRGNVGLVSPGVLVNPGDVVDIIGNWSPVAATGGFTAHNSYTATMTNFATTIEGVPHNIQRCGWQWDVGDATWVGTGTTGTYLAPSAGQMGRVLMYTAPVAGTIATNTTLGAGCINVADVSSYENFASSAAFDLSNTPITLLHTGSGYLAMPGTTTYVAPSATAQVIAAGDDVEAMVTLSQPMPVGASGTTTSLAVCSNGFISSATGNGTTWTPTPATFLNGPQAWWSLCWHDFTPTLVGSGQIKFEQIGTIAYVTWDGVWDFGGTTAANANTMQAQFDVTTGTVHFVYGAMSALGNGRLVGFSSAGPSADPGSMDISAALPATYSAATFAVTPLALSASTRPITGTSWNLTTSNIPATGVIGIEVFGLSDPGINDLFFLGMPGCGLRSSLDVLNAYPVTGPTHGYSLAIPANPALIGIDVFTTSAVAQLPAVNAFGFITSNGIKGGLGDV